MPMIQKYRELLHAALAHRLVGNFSPIPETVLKDVCFTGSFGSVVQLPSTEESAKLFSEGLAELRSGQYALMILSGGQATRVGTTLPKALLPISPVKRKTLLQLHLERLKRLCDLMGPDCPQPYVFILTSSFNHSSISWYLQSVRHCGLDKNRIVLLQQGNTPCLRMDNHGFFTSGPDGSRSQDTDDAACERNLVVSPNGNGAIYEALAKSKLFMELLENLKMLHVIAIDNSLSRPLDPELVGLSLRLPGLEILNKCIRRMEKENLGVFCRGEVPLIVEYSELEKLKDPSFIVGANVYGNICDHMFSGMFLKRIMEERLYNKLPYHVAKKVVPYYDRELQREIVPQQPNGYKLELFIFDIFQFASRIMCLEVDRNLHFAPVKYVCDYDAANIHSVQHKMSDVAKKWLKASGAEVGDGFVDISPTLSYAGEGLEAFLSKRIEGPIYLQ